MIAEEQYRGYLNNCLRDKVLGFIFKGALFQPEREISYKEEVIETSRERYGRPRKEVEKEILFKGRLEAKRQIKQEGLSLERRK